MENKTKTIIEWAIKGGYKSEELESCTIHFIHENSTDGKEDCLCIDNSYTDQFGERRNKARHYSREEMLLDPKFFQAIGDSMGWEDGVSEIAWRAGKGRDNWKDTYLKFHQINADTLSLESAIDYLYGLLSVNE